MTRAPRAYPWAALPAVAPEEARAVRALRALAASDPEASFARALGELVGARVEILVKRVRAAPRGAPGEGDPGVLVAAEDAGLARAVLVEAEVALATRLVGRVIRREARTLAASPALSSEIAGAFAAVVHGVARRGRARDGVPRVVSAGPAKALAADLAQSAGELYEATLTVLVDDDAYAARVLVPRAMAAGAPGPAWTRRALATLGDTPLALSVVAGTSRSTALEVGTLRRGDAWMLGAHGLRRGARGGVVGKVLLAAPAHEVGLVAALGEDGRVVLGAGTERLSWARAPEEDVVGEGETESEALVEAVGEVPVAVRVEIGVVEMPARAWASLGAGDVVGLGTKLGEAVTLRVGGVTVARGELVDLDGEIGVRILGRTGAR